MRSVIFTLLFLAASIPVYAYSDSADYDEYKRTEAEELRVFKNLKTCTKDKTTLGGKYINGMRNGKCMYLEYFSGTAGTQSYFDCLLPMNEAKRYAEAGINYIENSGNSGTGRQYVQAQKEIILSKKYCKYSVKYKIPEKK